MRRIEVNTTWKEPPLWATLERDLIQLVNDSISPVLTRYVREDGTLMWPTTLDHRGIDALDDAYESFHNWPLFYLLGGDERFLDVSISEFAAITSQFSRYDCGHGHPMVVKEYEQGYDWFHQGEGYEFFYLLCMAAPNHQVNIERAKRFAGFYLNEDESIRNYDTELKLVKCAHVGSMGPAYRNFTGEPWGYEEWKSYYGLPFMDVPGCNTIEDMRTPANALKMGQVMKERMSRGDVAMNLSITSMITNAYLLTGDEKYKTWVKDYVEAWIDRTRSNNGILPDNIGHSGNIGEYIHGKWYGGYYGWTWPHGWLSIGDAAVIAGENATLLFGDVKYLDLPRSQIDVLIKNGVLHDGTLLVPYKYGDSGCYDYRLWIEGVLKDDNGHILWNKGWFEFQPMDPRYPVHVWNLSMDSDDVERLVRVRNNEKRDWERIVSYNKKDQGGHELPWVSFLQGEFPNYPEEILRHNISQVRERLQLIEHDQQDPSTYTDSYLQARNPVAIEGLVQLTMGAPLPIYNGGLLMARIRYFDFESKRPGLPKDVGALVEKISENGAVLRLVNLNTRDYREVVLQAGSFGEHIFITVRYCDDDGENVFDINAKAFVLGLKPSGEVTLELGMQRFVNQPMYRMPWEDEKSRD